MDNTNVKLEAYKKMLEGNANNNIDIPDVDENGVPILADHDTINKLIEKENRARVLAGEEKIQEVEVIMDEEEVEDGPIVDTNFQYAGDGMAIEDDDEELDDSDNKGLVITKDEFIKGNKAKTGPMSEKARLEESLVNNSGNYLKSMDEEIEKHVKFANEIKDEILSDDEYKELFDEDLIPSIAMSTGDDEEDAKIGVAIAREVEMEDFEEKHKEAVIFINKLGLGKIEFSPEEKAKLREVESITLKEVRDERLKTIEFKKKITGVKSSKRLINDVLSANRIEMPLPCSGISVTVRASSIYELQYLSVINQGNENLKGMELALEKIKNKAKFIHRHIITTSIGYLEYDDFIKVVAFNDMDDIMHAISMITTPKNKGVINVKCDKCGKYHRYDFNSRDLLRPELFTNTFTKYLEELKASTVNKEKSELFRRTKGPLMDIKRIELPSSGIIVDMGPKSIEEMLEEMPKIAAIDFVGDDYAILFSFLLIIRAMGVFDKEINDYVGIEEPQDLFDMLLAIDPAELKLIALQFQEITENMDYVYGFTNVDCSNCGHHRDIVTIDTDIFETMVFIPSYQEIRLEKR